MRRGFPCHSCLIGLTLRADQHSRRRKITQRSRKATVTTPVPLLGWTGNIWFFSWREESHSHTQTAAESPGTAKSILRCGFSFSGQRHDKLLTLETLLMAGALLWRMLSHVTSGGNQNNPTTCVYTRGMCSESMWCQVQFTTWIVKDPGSQPLF